MSASPPRPPSVDAVLREPAIGLLVGRYGRPLVVRAIRLLQAADRAGPGAPIPGDYPRRVAAWLDEHVGQPFRAVHNLTGTLLHTNLGRAILPRVAIDAIVAAAAAPVSLEYDLGRGRRGQRDRFVAMRIAARIGAEGATLLNNNAAALLVLLNTLARGREVVVSRGELVEIGGSFRLPELMERTGCRLREVGTTNRTHLRDYADAIGPDTALLLKVHPSNYAIRGFTREVSIAELGQLSRQTGVPLAVDVGSGALVRLSDYGLPDEVAPAQVLEAGAALVTFSGDKLLGGPQAGIVAGDAALIAELDRNPLKRALRLDKLTLAALAAVVDVYDRDAVDAELPFYRALRRGLEELEASAQRLAARLQGCLGAPWRIDVVASAVEPGSGALPDVTVPSRAVRVRGAAGDSAAMRLAEALRGLPVPVVGRIHDGALWLDLRPVDDIDALLADIAALPGVDLS